jgi:hypothetical protein
MLFTYNPAFGKEDAEKYFEKYGIDGTRVVVIGQPAGKKKTYATECSSMVSAFFKHHTVNKDDHIMSDGGKSFMVRGVNIFDDLGYKKHAVYPSPVHQFLSPNDNRLHGVAKQRMRTAGIDLENDVESSLHLMWELDQVKPRLIKKWFNTNLQLGEDEATNAASEACIFSFSRNQNDRADWYKQCRAKYAELEVGRPGRGHGHAIVKPMALNSSFDGSYWNNFGKWKKPANNKNIRGFGRCDERPNGSEGLA